MPRYFFSTANGHRIKDDVGDLLANETAARDMAIDVLSEVLPSQREQLGNGGQYTVTVTDENNIALYEITASARQLSR